MNGIGEASRPNAAPVNKPIRFVPNLDASPYAKRRRISSACLVHFYAPILPLISDAITAMSKKENPLLGGKAGLQELLSAQTRMRIWPF
jgi:hypothetical protein